MKFRIIKIVVALSGLLWSMPMMAQFDFMRAMSALSKVTQAATISDDQVAAYVKEYVMYMDEKNNVAGPSDPYTVRLDRLTAGLIDVEGIPLNFKVYKTKDVNAFACADGSVRVFSSLMDIMSDDELLGVIGHEIGHVAHHDSKKVLSRHYYRRRCAMDWHREGALWRCCRNRSLETLVRHSQVLITHRNKKKMQMIMAMSF